MLTLKKLKDMPDGTIFATGTGKDRGHDIRWLAKRGNGYHDWCIYYHLKHYNLNCIARSGDKFCSKDKIKKMVPCDDEAFAMYRY